VPDEIDEADLEAGVLRFSAPQTPTYNHDLRTPFFAELDALALEEEEEGTSYLADLSAVPDFVDEPPVELGDVSSYSIFLGFHY